MAAGRLKLPVAGRRPRRGVWGSTWGSTIHRHPTGSQPGPPPPPILPAPPPGPGPCSGHPPRRATGCLTRHRCRLRRGAGALRSPAAAALFLGMAEQLQQYAASGRGAVGLWDSCHDRPLPGRAATAVAAAAGLSPPAATDEAWFSSAAGAGAGPCAAATSAAPAPALCLPVLMWQQAACCFWWVWSSRASWGKLLGEAASPAGRGPSARPKP